MRERKNRKKFTAEKGKRRHTYRLLSSKEIGGINEWRISSFKHKKN
jgi:hypothetical protein